MVKARENEPILIRIAARRPDSDSTEGMVVFVNGVPMGSGFSMGRQDGERWVFAPQDFGEVELNLPPGTSGRLVLEITAIADGASRHRSLVIYIPSNDTTTDETTTDQATSDEGTTPTTVPTRQTPSTEDPQTVTMGEAPSMGTSTVSIETPLLTDETPAISDSTPQTTGMEMLLLYGW